MKNDQTRAWAHDLRTTTAGQARQRLVSFDIDGKRTYCCMGRLCVIAGLEPDFSGHFDGMESYPPRSALSWLGVRLPSDLMCTNLKVDWPTGAYYMDPNGTSYALDPVVNDYANLNDELRLTFPQIADIVDYFGVKDVYS